MNLVLFRSDEERRTLLRDDRRFQHLVSVLRIVPGDRVAVGIVGGAVTSARVTTVEPERIVLDWDGDDSPAQPLLPLTVVVGHPRPIVLRRLVKDLATLGVSRILVFRGELSEKSYLESSIWSDGSLDEALLLGAEQAGTTVFPSVSRLWSLERAIAAVSGDSVVVFSPDGPARPRDVLAELRGSSEVAVVLGPERGFSEKEENLIARTRCTRVRMGERTIRTETACLLAVGAVATATGWW